MPLASRNESEGFAERTRKNLEYIERAEKQGADVHVITQLANSLLGLVAFPWMESFQKSLEESKLGPLDWSQWDIWKDDEGDCVTLDKLVWHLRNAAAHRHIEFTSESRKLEEVVFEFKDRPNDNQPYNWCARIRGTDLCDFCCRFVQKVVNTIG